MRTTQQPRTVVRAALTLTTAALLLGSTLAPASAAEPDPTQNGGAARNAGDMTDALRASIVDTPAKNVILLIGDGMGDSEITVARNYAEGAGGRFAGLDALPLTGQYTTYSLTKAGVPDYVPDSAATGSAWSTGTKTYDNAISVDIAGAPQATLLEIAKANGLKTGDVSTAEIQDATPAVEVSHVTARSCYGPVKTSTTCPTNALENGGAGSISEQLLDVRPDVTLGGGAATFNETAKAGPWAGQSLFDQAADRGYTVVRDAAGLDALTVADQSAPVLGLFTDGNFPVRWNGPTATTGGGDLAPAQCTDNPGRLASGLSLASLTDKAISLLDNEDGFFLQVEGASIDKQDHSANACGQIGETVDLDEAVQVALDFAKKDGNTLVVVTADHAHTSQIVDSTPPGLSVALTTTEGGRMIVSYGTSAAGGSQQHTGTQLRIAGYGPGAANVVGLTDQTDLFFTAANSLGLTRDLPSLSSGATLTLSQPVVAPGAALTVTASGLAADWTTSAMLGSTALGRADVIDGAATFTGTAPTTEGAQTITLRGAQTGVELTATLTVSADAPTSPPVTPAPDASTPDGAGVGVGGTGPTGGGNSTGGGSASSGGGLATTGTEITLVAMLALTLAGAGTVIVRRSRRSLLPA
ncbi:alkaline phosphatase [Sanguibacter gelidistatuariae]|uniref:Alkaline phosphatase n=1 Tax=Sanguibacter gelidistatuariae TaxID=1814289 RepID=A0A1G6H4F7_9MICO|nr:alkaline phosphatase [Sanguibacter gelidistatuariae]SDB89179.1 alkaline phosphatase [Sanguibacter gelidistatuariae]